MDDREYKQRELLNFEKQNSAYFDSVSEFDEALQNMDVLEQIDWIEKGSYGAGACLSLQKALNSLNNRTNNKARIGNVVLHAFYGKPFRYWNKLSYCTQCRLNAAITTWLLLEHEFAIQSDA